ncbi:hypothetical protein [Oligosphaera ethanolica]|uniref:Uncharacterized protein n=1 Tax=Oligosphaera ethanolica TaxID=760260 RepID=A0AAE4APR0_9BACT|nr:hypothetical protein [Oligosphaera ethanolica]MDQ0291594.1 hypothetical protein [Oligosphaera ethanolica]
MLIGLIGLIGLIIMEIGAVKVFWLWLIIVLLLAALLELLAGGSGFAMPVLAVAGFYFAVLRHWRPLLLPYMAAGLALDLCFARVVPPHVLIMPLVLFGGRMWCFSGELKTPLVQALPGAGVGLLASLAVVGGQLLQGHAVLSQPGQVLFYVLENVLWGMILLPLSCLVLDGVARFLALRRYSRVTPHDHVLEEDGKDALSDEQ